MGYLVSGSEATRISSEIDLSFLESTKILVTGGTGMIGSYLTEVIVSALEISGTTGWSLSVTSNRGDFSNLEQLRNRRNVDFLTIPAQSDETLHGFDYVFHLASPGSPTKFGSLDEMNLVNSGYMSKFYSKSSGPEKLLFVSSGEIYGSRAPMGVSEVFAGNFNHSQTRATYPISKQAAEKRILELAEAYGTNVYIARLFHTFGPGLRPNDGRSFGDFLERAVAGQAPQLRSNGKAVRSFLYTFDAVSGFLRIIKTEHFDQSENIYNVGSDFPVTIAEFATIISEVCNLAKPVFMAEILENSQVYEQSPNPVVVPDVTRLKSIGWEQKFDLRYAIKRTVNWLRTNTTT